MTQNTGKQSQNARAASRLQQPPGLPLALPKAPVYILGETPTLESLNECLARYGCSTSLDLLRPTKVWADLHSDILAEADKVLEGVLRQDLGDTPIVFVLPPLVSLAAALVVRIKETCIITRAIILHYRPFHTPSYIGFEMYC